MGVNILSLFDGVSCGQIAFERAGIKIENYFASEIDKYAIQITQENYPETIQLGDINGWTDWKLPKIDFLIGGSPCQGFSRARKGNGFLDIRSGLVFEFFNILENCDPRFFILENVKLKKDDSDIVSEFVGVNPIHLNSSSISAQNRLRSYWTNIENITVPQDRGILLKDIVDRSLDNFYEGNVLKENTSRTELLIKIGEADLKGFESLRRVYSINGKCPTLTTMQGGYRQPKISINGDNWRRVSPLECERLQTIPDNYTGTLSNSQRYKTVGNAFTVNMIVHLLNSIKDNS